MKSAWRSWAVMVLLLIAAIIILQRAVASGSQLSWTTFHWLPVLVALAATVLQELLNPWLAKLSLRAIGQDGGYWRLLGIVTTTSASNAVIPLPAGIPLRVWLQKRWLGISYPDSTLAAVLESFVSYGVLGLAAILSMVAWAPDLLRRTASLHSWILLCCTLAMLAMAALCIRLLINRYAPTAATLFRLKRSSRLGWKSVLAVAAINILGVALAYVRIVLLGWALSVSALDWGLVFTGLVVSRLAGVASMIPMGLGARDVSLGYFLILAGASASSATAWVILDRLVMTIPYLMIGLLSMPMLRRAQQTTDSGSKDSSRTV
jgi:uncharacterized membrane protein YbhN (UPF0104 family)